jgi:hypothetical protein
VQRAAALLFAFVFSTFVSRAQTVTQSKPGDLGVKLNKVVESYNLGSTTPVAALIRASNDFQIPLGIVLVDTQASRTKIPLSWGGATVQQVVETIASALGARATTDPV